MTDKELLIELAKRFSIPIYAYCYEDTSETEIELEVENGFVRFEFDGNNNFTWCFVEAVDIYEGMDCNCN